MEKNKFNFFVGFDEETEDILKSASKNPSKKYDNMIIAGRATTNLKDRQGEELQPNGFVIDDFLKSGLINLEHFYVRKSDPASIIGEPIDAYIKDNEFYVKGKLYKGHKKAEDLWDTLLLMKANGSTRKIGWSIEGKRLAVDPKNKKRITKAKINHIALTFSPVGYNTYADISKGQQAADYIEPAYDEKEIDGHVYILQFEKDDKIITVNTDYSVSIKNKAMDTDTTRALMKESLKKMSIDITDWDNIMKAIKGGYIKKEKIPLILQKIYKKNLIV
jgi:hypothetical protein